jgi:hypothetical protein
MFLRRDSSRSNLSLVLIRRYVGSNKQSVPFLTQRAHGGWVMPQRTLACRHLLHAILALSFPLGRLRLLFRDVMFATAYQNDETCLSEVVSTERTFCFPAALGLYRSNLQGHAISYLRADDLFTILSERDRLLDLVCSSFDFVTLCEILLPPSPWSSLQFNMPDFSVYGIYVNARN